MYGIQSGEKRTRMEGARDSSPSLKHNNSNEDDGESSSLCMETGLLMVYLVFESFLFYFLKNNIYNNNNNNSDVLKHVCSFSVSFSLSFFFWHVYICETEKYPKKKLSINRSQWRLDSSPVGFISSYMPWHTLIPPPLYSCSLADTLAVAVQSGAPS